LDKWDEAGDVTEMTEADLQKRISYLAGLLPKADK
jgi:hypothetical protein